VSDGHSEIVRLSLAVAVIVILAVAVGAVALGFPRGGRVRSTTGSGSGEASSSTGQISTSVGQSSEVAYTVNGTFVSRFCSNSSSIPVTSDAAAGLQPSGNVGPLGVSVVGVSLKDTGSSPVQIVAVCVDAAGIVPANATDQGLITGATARTIQLSVSPSNPIQPGQGANITATFTGGSGVYYMPQGGLTYVIIASDGSKASWTGPEGVGYLITETAPSPVVSLQEASLFSGSLPILSAVLRFNSTLPITEVDISMNGTYLGTAGVGHDTSSPGAANLFDVSYKVGINEPGRVLIVRGDTYVLTFVAATRGFQETSVSTSVVAG